MPTNELPAYVLQQMRYLLDETDLSTTAIAKRLNIHRVTVWRCSRNWELFGEPYAPSCTRKGRPRVLNTFQEEVGRQAGD
jgi:transposase